MNKKVIILSSLLILALFLISSCVNLMDKQKEPIGKSLCWYIVSKCSDRCVRDYNQCMYTRPRWPISWREEAGQECLRQYNECAVDCNLLKNDCNIIR